MESTNGVLVVKNDQEHYTMVCDDETIKLDRYPNDGGEVHIELKSKEYDDMMEDLIGCCFNHTDELKLETLNSLYTLTNGNIMKLYE